MTLIFICLFAAISVLTNAQATTDYIPGQENPDQEITYTSYYQHFIAANISLGFAF